MSTDDSSPCDGYEHRTPTPDGAGSVCWTRTSSTITMHVHDTEGYYMFFPAEGEGDLEFLGRN